MNYGLLKLTENVVLAHSLFWTSSIDDIEINQTTTQTTFSSVIRPEYSWDNNKTVVELGYFDSTTADDSPESAMKVTLAQTWSPSKSFWARPELRVFATYFKDNEDEQAFGDSSDTEFQVGVQVEG